MRIDVSILKPFLYRKRERKKKLNEYLDARILRNRKCNGNMYILFANVIGDCSKWTDECRRLFESWNMFFVLFLFTCLVQSSHMVRSMHWFVMFVFKWNAFDFFLLISLDACSYPFHSAFGHCILLDSGCMCGCEFCICIHW